MDVLDVSRGNIVTAASKYEVPPLDLPRGFNVDNAARIRKGTGMLTIGVGRINDPQQAEDILEADKVDMVVMGRAQLADPDFCNKCREGRVEEIDRCVGCNQGCLDGFADLNMPHITCLRNPAIGRETECSAAMQPAQSPKTILIAGGGIAGLEAARTLKLKGHHPILCEASDALGGQFVLAGKAPRKEEMEAAIQSMASQVQRMGVDVRLNTPVTPELIEEIKPAAVFNCIGATPLIPKIPGAEGAHVANSHDVLAGKVKPAGRVVIIGGGMVGMEVAELLARSPRFKVRVLARPSDKNRALLKKMAHPMLEVVWGDMADFACVKRCVAGSDYVLHIGAMVSPAADKYPEKTLYTNIGSTLAIIKAIQEQPNADDIHLVYVGTVAETGDRQYPVQMGRCGDPINPSIHDYDELVPPAMRQARVCSAALRKRELLKIRHFRQLARKHGENFGKKRENWTVPALLTRFFYEMLFHPGFVPVSKRACIRLYTML